ncbi:MAG: BatA domain-containing protein [bacterium]
MSFGQPAALLALLLVPVFVFLYVRRAGRRETVVPDLSLWKAVAAETRAEAGRRLGALDLPLVLAILFFVAVISAVARPVLTVPSARSPVVLLVVDRSASLKARAPGGGSRWDQAVEAAADVLEGLTGELLLIGLPLGAGPGLSEMPASDAAARLRGMGPTDLPLDLPAELTRCAGVAGQRAAAVLVVTDRPGAVPRRLGGVPVLVVSSGGPVRNGAIDAFEVRRGADGALVPFVAVKNHGAGRLTGWLELAADGVRAARRRLELAGRSRRVFGDLPGLEDAGVVEARIALDDDLAVDDRAIAVAAGTGPVRVALVGRENPFVERALGLLPGVELSRFRLTGDVAGEFDLVIYDSVTPARLPEGDVVLISPRPDAAVGPFRIGAAARHSPPVGAVPVADSSLLENVDVGALRFERVLEVTGPAGARPVLAAAEGRGTVLMTWAGPEGWVTVIGCGVILSETNWPMTASFPIFWSNVIERTRGAGGAVPTWFPVGGYIAVGRPAAGPASVTGPDGEPVDVLPGQGARDYFLPTVTGVYTVEAGERRTRCAVNLIDAEESGAAGAVSRPSASDVRAALAPVAGAGVPLWRYFSVAALVLGFAHWGVAGRDGRR